MQMAITFMALVAGLVFSLAIALLAEELIFGQVFRLFFAPAKLAGPAPDPGALRHPRGKRPRLPAGGQRDSLHRGGGRGTALHGPCARPADGQQHAALFARSPRSTLVCAGRQAGLLPLRVSLARPGSHFAADLGAVVGRHRLAPCHPHRDGPARSRPLAIAAHDRDGAHLPSPLA